MAAFNSELWATAFARQMATVFASDRGDIELCNELCKEAGQRRTSVWQNGWNMAWTHAYIALCSILESEYSHPDSRLLLWVGIEDARQFSRGSCVVRRWKSRETGQWLFALSTSWQCGDDGEFMDCQFLLIN